MPDLFVPHERHHCLRSGTLEGVSTVGHKRKRPHAEAVILWLGRAGETRCLAMQCATGSAIQELRGAWATDAAERKYHFTRSVESVSGLRHDVRADIHGM